VFIRFSHVMLSSPQLDNSVKWYCEKLGFKVNYHVPQAFASLSHPKVGKITLHSKNDLTHIGHGPLPYLLVEEIRETINELRLKDIHVSDPRREGTSPWFAEFKDLDGNIWGLEEQE
jgi:catechol 2,3-dioxygenase-like lactoylglutathione lyase family enzyme